ncbi:MAG: response regulator transcription factor [Acidobacteriia bacterium]|nr:response regulator transcription factor [Terriglobia bacterium]
MKLTGEVVNIVDDDASVRDALSELLTSLKIENRTFGSAEEYLAFNRTDVCACLILDVHLPELSGLELQQQLAGSPSPPIVFITGRGDIPSTVRAMKAGAIEFLTKPIDPGALLAAIRAAFAEDLGRRKKRAEVAELQRRFSALTPREKVVLPLVVSGMLNKQAAHLLGITEVTLQVHRGQIMRKMEANSFAELVRMAEKLRIYPPDGTV